jgi:hypothetical protein
MSAVGAGSWARSACREDRVLIQVRVVVALTAMLASCIARADEGVTRATGETHDYDPTPFTPCPHCRVFIGVGATYQLWGWSEGIVVPVTFEFNDSRWELGAFRMARAQIASGYGPPDKIAAEPYWGFSAMRRWQFLHRSWGKLYFGFGGSYKTEVDYLDATRWNFAYVLALRMDLGTRGSLVEIGTRHWSNAWIKQPNRGQNFLTVSVSF